MRSERDRPMGPAPVALAALVGHLATVCIACPGTISTHCQQGSECPDGFYCSPRENLCLREVDAGQPVVRIDSFGADPNPIEWGSPTTLAFEVSNANSCSVDGAEVCQSAACNNLTIGGQVPFATHTYELICEGPGGPAVSELVVTVSCANPLTVSGTTEPATAQDDLDALGGAITTCFEIDGDLVIADSQDIFDLTVLEGLVRVTGDLRIYNNAALASLDGLESLQTVGGDLLIGEYNSSAAEHQGNLQLASIRGLSGLRDVGASLEIDDFQEGRASPLLSVDGLQELRHVAGFMLIQYHEQLADLSALRRLTTVGAGAPSEAWHYFWLDHLPALVSLDGLQQLTWIGGGLGVRWCHALTTLAPLHGVAHVGAKLEIHGNAGLTSLGLNTACEFGGPDFTITDNPLLSSAEAQALADAWTADSPTAYHVTISGNAP